MIRDAFDQALAHGAISCDVHASHRPNVHLLCPSEQGVVMTTVVVTPPTLVKISVDTSNVTRVYDTTSQYTPILLDTSRSIVRVEGPEVPPHVIFEFTAQGPL